MQLHEIQARIKAAIRQLKNNGHSNYSIYEIYKECAEDVITEENTGKSLIKK